MNPAAILAILFFGSVLFGVGLGASVALIYTERETPEEQWAELSGRTNAFHVARLVWALGCGLLLVGLLSVMGMAP